MTQGTIKNIQTGRGFGFIAPDTGAEDLFFHHSAVESPTFEELNTGQRVEFELGSDPRNPTRQRAMQVRVTDLQQTFA